MIRNHLDLAQELRVPRRVDRGSVHARVLWQRVPNELRLLDEVLVVRVGERAKRVLPREHAGVRRIDVGGEESAEPGRR